MATPVNRLAVCAGTIAVGAIAETASGWRAWTVAGKAIEGEFPGRAAALAAVIDTAKGREAV